MCNANQIILDEYLQITRKMLSLGKIRIGDVYPSVRLIRPEFYRIALKASNQISKQHFLEDMQLLKQDIDRCDELIVKNDISCEHKSRLEDMFNHFLKRNRFKGDKDIEFFKESI